MSIFLPEHHIYSVTALTLKFFDLNEADRVYTLFTKEQGIIRAAVNGIKTAKHRFAGRMDLLRSNHLVIRRKKGLDKIIHCDTHKHFSGLMTDYERLLYGLFIADMLDTLCQEADPNPALYELMLNTLAALEVAPNPLPIVIRFELGLLAEIGYQQTFSVCHQCERSLTQERYSFFDMIQGGLYCSRCKPKNKHQLLNHSLRHMLEQIQSNTNLNDLDQTEALGSWVKIQHMLQTYVQNIAEKELKSLKLIATL